MTFPVSSWRSAARTGSGRRALHGPGGNCSSPPTRAAFVEQVNVVGDAVSVQELVELLVIDAVRTLDLPVQARCARPDVGVTDVERLQMPMKV